MTSIGPRHVRRLLVANRAEIASRVFRTCRALGIETVAVHSDPDADLPYVREADVAVRLPGTSPADTYLRADLLVAAARRSGADAVHPGYGFLSENADFARAVLDAGLTWIGPTPESIEAMGSKIRAKELMRDAGVPVLEAPADPTDADLPLLVKASAGGGGRGMRVVRRLADLGGEVARARAEAESAFGDGTVFVEPYVEQGRHVEVQVVGTRDGVLVLGERDCSIQRRHQKVVEEAPAPGLAEEVRAALHEAGRAAAAAIGYLGAGTVEFLLDPGTGRFWFLEMNTRLQVEHPVTELVHGVDLVAMQVAVAETGSCASRRAMARPGAHDPVRPEGHAIEVRLYAEDPAAGYQPQSGRVTTFDIPAEDGIRVDAGFESGSEVSTHYDAMLAKVVAHAPTRSEAARKLAGVLSRARIHGVVTNRDQLLAVLRDERFLAGEVSTDFLAGRTFRPTGVHADAAVAAAIGVAERARTTRTVQQGIPIAWRNVTSQPQRTTFTDPGGHQHAVEWWGGRDGYRTDGVTVVTASADRVVLERDGVRSAYDLVVSGLPGREVVDVDSAGGHVRLTRVPRFTDPATQVATGSLLAPMPGTVVSVAVAKGVAVSAGQPVLVLEAMKMQHTVSAPHAGVVDRIDVEPGVQVAAGEVLAVVTSDPAPEEES
jgi:propionyl-CoA carboxylase alpha chain